MSSGYVTSGLLSILLSFLRPCLSDTISLTPSNPGDSSSDIAWITMVENNGYHVDNGISYECSSDGTDQFCVYLTIRNSADCYGYDSLEFTMYGSPISGNSDLFTIFSVENSNGNTDYFSFLSDWDSQVQAGLGGGIWGGVFNTPNQGSNTLLSTNSLDTIFDQVTDDNNNRAVIGQDQWELLTSERITKSANGITYKLLNDPIKNELSASFYAIFDDDETPFTEVTATFNAAFDSYDNENNNYVIGFSVDSDGAAEFTQFDVTVGCTEYTREPTSVPTKAPTSCEYTHKCTAWGDPHMKTFDNTRYHFQGEGYFDYFKTCPTDLITYSYPFIISAHHWQCRTSATCIDEILVTLDDGNIISFPSTGNPVFKDNDEQDAIGSYQFYDSNGNIVFYTVSKYNFEIEFNYEGQTAMVKFNYYDRSFTLWTTDCLYGDYNICGLCGNINDIKTDDFMTCDNLEILDSDGSSYTFSGDVWENVHEFGESCCRADLDNEYYYTTDCGDNPTVPEGPDVACMNAASFICEEIYNTYCVDDCIHIDLFEAIDTSDDSMDDSDIWIESCEYDVCAIDECSDGIQNQGWQLNDALSQGCLNTQINQCFMERFGQVAQYIVG